MKTIILGMGNTIVSDDGVGLYVVRELEARINKENIDFQESSLAGFRLLDLLSGYDRVIVVDSIKTSKVEPGQVYKLDVDSLKSTFRLASAHDINFATALEFGEMMEMKMPDQIDIYAIEVVDNQTFHEGCTPKVEAAIPRIVDEIIEDLGLGDTNKAGEVVNA
ncbi:MULTISPECIES: hydrogenase maturation protease [unclassified Candidatus Frackibacter]|uniref:hydrogenase maturation protease n=1 Tax=unclassified Candidatus Frackibacter TaxID=2648818 RepID=UPI0007973DA2|nr:MULTISPECIES: hydrogenase maturation protease [unclassified Candidatus Frackibacter]KXS45348.1 MAG: hydrogenase maturation protease [Candidatus Frackibacter sp. T328-2]SDC77413.1 hydrogenase maturation protease [Candidatus Frackibacter sp. WG11]SEM90474.1 hydrogenase maturation protease [Candidatus Frackibacter sp. WG12]SFM00223.1 hydrogenase maturation protease [Candidatus Frackibacter sp. WG13]